MVHRVPILFFPVQWPDNGPNLHPKLVARKTFTSSVLCVITYLHTAWSRVLLEKLTGLQLVKKFPAFCGTRRFITALTSARHL